MTLLFSSVNPKQCISIYVVDDSTIEMEERLLVQLKHSEQQLHYELLQGSTAVIITDNDGEYCIINNNYDTLIFFLIKRH